MPTTDTDAARAIGNGGEDMFVGLCRQHRVLIVGAHERVRQKFGLQLCKPMPVESHGDFRVRGVMARLFLIEVKKKNPTGDGFYGLEDYRLRGLTAERDRDKEITDAVYMIFDKDVGFWLGASLTSLLTAPKRFIVTRGIRAQSLFAGKMQENVPTWYWPVSCWKRDLSEWFPSGMTLVRAGIEMTSAQWDTVPAEIRARYWQETDWAKGGPASSELVEIIRQCLADHHHER